MKSAFIGFGALGRQVAGLMEVTAADQVIFDDHVYSSGAANAYPFSEYASVRFESLPFFVCLGYKHLERKTAIVEELLGMGRRVPAFVHPSTFVSPTATIGEGAIVYPMCNLDQNTRLGRGALLHNSVVVSHDAEVGEGCYLSPGVVMCGDSSVGGCSFLGARAVLSNGARVGRGAIVGIGTVVAGAVPDGASAIGYPMRILGRRLELR